LKPITKIVLASLGVWTCLAGQIEPAYRASFEKWRLQRIQSLKQNWVPLAGLFWLSPGSNSLGADESNAIRLPDGSAPARAGDLELANRIVTLKMAAGSRALIDGKAVSAARLDSDLGGKPTIVALGRIRMHVIERGERIGVRVKDLESPALKNFTPPECYPLDPQYRVTARFVPSDGSKRINVANVLGDNTPTVIPGEVRFSIDGRDYSLTAIDGNAREGLFIAFSDPTNKTETYPPGRFLDTPPVVNGKVEVDFNRSYNPPCSVTPFATCPIAPAANRLPIAIRAGEKYDHGKGH
jgi:uncharacterized protein